MLWIILLLIVIFTGMQFQGRTDWYHELAVRMTRRWQQLLCCYSSEVCFQRSFKSVILCNTLNWIRWPFQPISDECVQYLTTWKVHLSGYEEMGLIAKMKWWLHWNNMFHLCICQDVSCNIIDHCIRDDCIQWIVSSRCCLPYVILHPIDWIQSNKRILNNDTLWWTEWKACVCNVVLSGGHCCEHWLEWWCKSGFWKWLLLQGNNW